MREGTVTWRFELPLSWGGRLDQTWLPNGDPESWRNVFAMEDRAGRVFAAGGAGMKWAPLAGTVGMLAGVLTFYREQLRAADDVAAACPIAAEQHVAAMAVPDGLQPPRVSGVGEEHDADATALLADRPKPVNGRWRHVVLEGGLVRTVSEHPDRATAVASVAAHRAVDDESARWAEPVPPHDQPS